MTFFPSPPSDHGSCEHESNPIPYPIYLYLSGSAFLVRVGVNLKWSRVPGFYIFAICHKIYIQLMEQKTQLGLEISL